MAFPIPPTPKKFLTNQGENTLSKRLEKILPLTRDFDCLVGYFFISGFFRLYPALEPVKKVRILIGLKNEQVVHGLIQIAKDGASEGTPSIAEIKATFGGMLRKELVQAEDTLAIETGVRKFIEWIRSDKLEVKLYREQNIHAKVYILTPGHPVESVNHGYLLALLNSRLYYQWLFHRGKRKGKMLEMMQIPLSEIPIKHLDNAGQKKFIELTNRILATKRRDAGANVSALEREIDEAVYALYALTPEEIQLIEASDN